MKYHAQFENERGDNFTVSSMEDYVDTPSDIADFSKVLDDEPVRKYIADDAKSRYEHLTTESLTKDILSNSALRWRQEAELRFLVRDSRDIAVGMIGVTLNGKTGGELWYYKISTAPAFMYEALSLVLGFLRSEGVEKLIATFELDNHRSERILSKLGFKNSSKPGEMTIDLIARQFQFLSWG